SSGGELREVDGSRRLSCWRRREARGCGAARTKTRARLARQLRGSGNEGRSCAASQELSERQQCDGEADSVREAVLRCGAIASREGLPCSRLPSATSGFVLRESKKHPDVRTRKRLCQ